jgi:CRP-like cAMP-binding protein
MVDYGALSRNPLFGGITPDEIENIRPMFEEHSYPPGVDIIREGETNTSIFFILEGEVEITKKAGPDAEKVLARFGEGETFGEMEFLDVQPCAASVRTLSKTTVMSLTNAKLYQVCCANVKTFAILVMNLARELSRRLRRMDDIMSREAEGRETREA